MNKDKVKARVQLSTINNKCRLKVLDAKNQYLNDIFNECLTELKRVNRKTAKYNKMIQKLILEVGFPIRSAF